MTTHLRKKPEELVVGDHIYEPKALKLLNLVSGDGETQYIYCHHGIVVMDHGIKKVISFTRKEDDEEGTEEEDEDPISENEELPPLMPYEAMSYQGDPAYQGNPAAQDGGKDELMKFAERRQPDLTRQQPPPAVTDGDVTPSDSASDSRHETPRRDDKERDDKDRHRDADEEEGERPMEEPPRRKTAIIDGMMKVASNIVSLLFRAEIKVDEVSTYTDTNGLVCVFQYDVHDEVTDFTVGACAEKEYNKERAAEIAHIFNDSVSDIPFGKYHLGSWNCECFAAFCKTTRHPTEELRQKVAALKGKRDYLPKNYIKTNGFPYSMQIRRFRKYGGLLGDPQTSSRGGGESERPAE